MLNPPPPGAQGAGGAVRTPFQRRWIPARGPCYLTVKRIVSGTPPRPPALAAL